VVWPYAMRFIFAKDCSIGLRSDYRRQVAQLRAGHFDTISYVFAL